MRVVVLAIALLIGISGFSQNPGYQGKKATLAVGVSAMPIIGFLASEESLFDFNQKFSIRGEYAVTRKIAVGFLFERINDIVMLQNYSETGSNPYVDFTVGQGGIPSSYPQTFESAANFYGNTYGGFVKFYHMGSGAINPLGRYIIVELKNTSLTVDDDGRYYNSEPRELYNLNSVGAAIGMGVENIYFDRVTFDFSFTLGLNQAGMRGVKEEEEYFTAGGNPMIKQIESKMFSDYLLQTRISVGYLIF